MKLKKELPLVLIVLLPFIYLAYIWNELPEKVPMHWNIKGEIDRYGEKIELLIIPFLLPFLVYIIFLVVPKIDPKKRITFNFNRFIAVYLFSIHLESFTRKSSDALEL